MQHYTHLTNFNKKLDSYYRQAIAETEKTLNKVGILSISKKAFRSNGTPIDYCHSIWYSCTIEELQTFHSFVGDIVTPHARDIVIEDLRNLKRAKTEFTSGAYRAQKGNYCWSVFILKTIIGIIDDEGETIAFGAKCPPTTKESLIELATLMDAINQQYKQLQTI